MVLIADTSVIIALLERLHRPEFIRYLDSMYGKVIVPASVVKELSVKNPELVDKYISSGTITITNIVTVEDINEFMVKYKEMGPGESDVILTWQRLNEKGVDAKCAFDDGRARSEAKNLSVKFTGVLGLLEEFKLRGYLSNAEHGEIISKLKASDFRIP